MEAVQATGLPLAEGITSALDLPHTLTYAIAYRETINSFRELPEDKRPPRNLWDKPWRLSQFFDEVWDRHSSGNTKTEKYIEYNDEDVE